jgi:2-keto-4-pentenoate hydratase/2-oxohepta-3-ene-1,7-dioic acid hydratase in catechol pathway
VRIVRFVSADGDPQYGLLDGDFVKPLKQAHPYGPLTVESAGRPLAEVRLLAPAEPSKIVLASGNYPVIVVGYESKGGPPASPTIFLKPNTTVIGPGEPIVYPRLSRKLTYEPELGIVIGRRARNIRATDAASFILGYTCVNDASARDIQESDEQWARGKSFDTLCPIGPWIVTDLDPRDLKITAYVNNRQSVETRTSLAYFDPYALFEFISACMTLLPGDVISTGASFLEEVHPGDEVAIEIEGIGRLTNPVIADSSEGTWSVATDSR